MRSRAHAALLVVIVLVGAAIIAFLLMFPPRKARVERPFQTPAVAEAEPRFTGVMYLAGARGHLTRGEELSPPLAVEWPWQSEVEHFPNKVDQILLRNLALGDRFDARTSGGALDLSYEARRVVALAVGSEFRSSANLHITSGHFSNVPGTRVVVRLALGLLPEARAGASLRALFTCGFGEPSQIRSVELSNLVPGRFVDFEVDTGWTHEACPIGGEGVNFQAVGATVLLAHPRVLYVESAELDQKRPRPNVVVINVDTLMPRALGFMGNTRGASPHLDALAAESLVFTQTFANGNWSKSSHASFFTSKPPHALGLKFWRNSNDALERGLWRALKHRTLVNAFQDAGYFTYGAVSNIFNSPVLPTGVDLGFDRFTDNPADLDHPLELIDDIERFLTTQRDAPFFLFFNPETPHYKYRPPREYLAQTGGVKSLETLDWDLYLGEVAYADAYVGRLLDLIDHFGLRKNTLVVVTSDHGEQLSKELAQAVYLRDPKDPFQYYSRETTRFRHGLSPFDEEWHVPFIVRLPDGSRAGERIDVQVEVMDQAPTILALAGLRHAPQFEGRDVSRGVLADRPALLEGRNFDALRAPPWKYVRRVPGTDLIAPEGEQTWRQAPESLYDLREGETRDVAAEHPEVVARLGNLLDARRGPPQSLWFFRSNAWHGSSESMLTIDLSGVHRVGLALASLGTRTFIVADHEAVTVLPVDGLAPSDIRVGALALPLIEALPAELGPELAKVTLSLGAPPVAGKLQIWRTPYTDGGPETTDTGALGKDLESALRSWGYAH